MGGAIALTVAARHQMPIFCENSFNRIEDTVKEYSTGPGMIRNTKARLEPYMLPDKEGVSTVKGRAYYALKDLLISIPHLVFRVMVFATLFFDHLFQGDFEEAFYTIFEIAKTILLDPLILISSFFVLLASPLVDLTFVLRFLNLLLCEDYKDSLFFVMMKSRLYTNLARNYLLYYGWKSEVADEWEKVETPKFISTAENDTVISWNASLGKAIQERFDPSEEEFFISPGSDHKDLLVQRDPKVYLSFLERALSITFSPEVKSTRKAVMKAFSEKPYEEALLTGKAKK